MKLQRFVLKYESFVIFLHICLHILLYCIAMVLYSFCSLKNDGTISKNEVIQDLVEASIEKGIGSSNKNLRSQGKA